MEDLMDDGLSRKPWEHFSYETEPGRIFKTVKDSIKLSFRKCDIVRYDKKYKFVPFGDWRDWFPEFPTKKKVQVYTNVPKYLSGQYGIIIQRFRIESYSINYGTTILLLTGARRGLLRQWYGTHFPFMIIHQFPYSPPFEMRLRKRLTKIFGSEPINLYENIEDSEEQRDWFLEKIWNYFTGETK
jgi:hypothetical protein